MINVQIENIEKLFH